MTVARPSYASGYATRPGQAILQALAIPPIINGQPDAGMTLASLLVRITSLHGPKLWRRATSKLLKARLEDMQRTGCVNCKGSRYFVTTKGYEVLESFNVTLRVTVRTSTQP